MPIDVLPRFTTFPKRVQRHMLNYYLAGPRSTFSLLELSDEAQKRLIRDIERLQQFYGFNAELVVSALQEFGYDPDELFVQRLTEIENEQGTRLRNFFRKQARTSEDVKALNPPIQIIPKSLHPVRLAA